jgi:hypothetical protein
MRINYLFPVLALGLGLPCGTALAQAVDDVAVEGAYVRAVPPGQSNSAAFMKISNQGAAAHALVGGSTPAAASPAAPSVPSDGPASDSAASDWVAADSMDSSDAASTPLVPGQEVRTVQRESTTS